MAVAGHTLGELPGLIANHLASYAAADAKLDVVVNVVAYNSKVCYVIMKRKDGDYVSRLPATGNETVVGAIFGVKDGAINAIKGRVSLARPSGEVLNVDWRGITQQGKLDTNYLMRSGDRVIIESPPLQ